MSTSENKDKKPVRARPLSPHLQVYRLPLSALTSISHRASGMVLTGGTLVIVGWLWALAFAPATFAWWQDFFKTPLGLAGTLAWTAALYYHLCAGIRHLVWDAGHGFAKEHVRLTNWLVILAALAMTAATWVYLAPKLLPPSLMGGAL